MENTLQTRNQWVPHTVDHFLFISDVLIFREQEENMQIVVR